MAKQTIYTEVNEMKAVDESLAQLDDDARGRVLSWALSKFNVRSTGPSVSGPGDSGRSSQASTGVPAGIKSFMAQKKPNSFYERVACLAYYLEKFDGKTELKTRDVTKANTDARLPKMSNPALFVKHTTNTYGYLSRLGQGKLGISGRGEALVEALPDRAKVEEALVENPFHKKGKKKRSSSR